MNPLSAMKPLRLLCLAGLILAGMHLSFASVFAFEKPDKLKMSIFKHPGNNYRSIYFYSLNDRLDTAVMARQIRAFAQAGGGGVFLHARIGLLTPILEPEWWTAIDAGVKACEKSGIQAWFYDEDRWPSGFAGGKVPLHNRDYLIESILKLPPGQKLPEEPRILCKDDSFMYVINKSRWGEARFNGTGYVDLMNPEVIKTFIEYGYKPYAERYKNKMGKSTFGMFTDEPQLCPRPTWPHKAAFSYSSVMPATFKQLHGYDFERVLPLLTTQKPGWEKARIDYFRTISYLFENSYFKQLGEYCKANNMPFTGHLLGEETPSRVARNSGSNMPHYRHMQIPGIDQLALGYISPYTPRCMTSVANQYGQAKRLSEAFGISGQNMNFEDRKWLLDWHTLFGINTITPHLSSYSLKGQRKRDYPPTFSEHQPYWAFNKIYEDYAARMCYAMSVGQYAASIGVVNPIETAYLELDMSSTNKWDAQIDRLTTDFLNQMQTTHRDYDLIDEQIAGEIAKSTKTGIQVGEMTYKLIILPNMKTIRNTTVRLLTDYTQKGGIVFYLGRFPHLVDGLPQPELLDGLRTKCRKLDSETLKEQLASALKPDFTLSGEDPSRIWTHLRTLNKGAGYVLQLSNTSRIKSTRVELNFAQKPAQLTLWNPVNGEAYSLEPNAKGGYDIPFAQTQTWVVSTGSAAEFGNERKPFPAYNRQSKPLRVLSGAWKGKRLDPNAITLDFACYSIDGGKHFSAPEPIIGIMQRLKEKKQNQELVLKFTVEIQDLPKRCSLVVEQPEIYHTLLVNGNPAKFGKEGYCDASFLTADVLAFLHRGANEIWLGIHYKCPIDESLDAAERYGSEVESIYFIGDFAVQGTLSSTPLATTQRNKEKLFVQKPIHCFKKFQITAEASEFYGSLALEGYPFYAGKFELTQTFVLEQYHPGKRYFLEFPLFESIVVQANLNGSTTAPMVFHPHEIEITPWIKAGENTLTLTLSNSLRNLFGPHHHVGGELVSVGPVSFTGRTVWTGNDIGENDWYEKRLTGKTGIWRDDYYIIPFGLLAAPILVER